MTRRRSHPADRLDERPRHVCGGGLPSDTLLDTERRPEVVTGTGGLRSKRWFAEPLKAAT